MRKLIPALLLIYYLWVRERANSRSIAKIEEILLRKAEMEGGSFRVVSPNLPPPDSHLVLTESRTDRETVYEFLAVER